MYSVTFHGFGSSWAAESFVYWLNNGMNTFDMSEDWYATGDSHKGEMPTIINSSIKLLDNGNVEVEINN